MTGGRWLVARGWWQVAGGRKLVAGGWWKETVGRWLVGPSVPQTIGRINFG